MDAVALKIKITKTQSQDFSPTRGGEYDQERNSSPIYGFVLNASQDFFHQLRRIILCFRIVILGRRGFRCNILRYQAFFFRDVQDGRNELVVLPDCLVGKSLSFSLKREQLFCRISKGCGYCLGTILLNIFPSSAQFLPYLQKTAWTRYTYPTSA